MPAVRLKAILPKGVLQPGAVARAVRNKVVDEGRIVERRLASTVATWRNAPKFKATQRVAPSESRAVSVTVSPAGDPEAVQHWIYVNDGTTVRWALMDPKFKPKTAPGQLKAGPGNPPFDPVLRGRKQMFAPRPGIQARNFTVLVKDERQKPFSNAVREAIRRTLARRGSTP